MIIRWGMNHRRALTDMLLTCLCVFVIGCVGGIGRVPTDADDILAKADRFFDRGKYLQSQQLYKIFLQRHPGHARSDWAQFRLGESFFGDEEWALAFVEYQILITNYGYSEYVDDAFLKQAICLYNQSPKSSLDQKYAEDALDKLEQFIQVFQDSPLMPEAERYIKLIHSKLAEKQLKTARFYISRKKYLSAMIYLDKIIADYPDNENWVRAKYWKGRAHELRGEYDEAARWYAEVMQYPEKTDVTAKAASGLRRLRK